MPSVRFDDLTEPGQSFRLEHLAGEITARIPREVAPAIEAAEAAARSGRWVGGFVSYEAAPGLNPDLTVRTTADADAPPLVWFGVFERRLAVDPPTAAASWARPEWRCDTEPAAYQGRVDWVRSHIGRGDTYQLNLTHRWRSTRVEEAADLYRQLLAGQRPAYGALIDTGSWVVASASPELFFDWRDGVVTCRPMKGTASRGRWPEEDRQARDALVESGKNRAENVMIVDLVRNDLGRVAEYGTVVVGDLLAVERYPTLWQLTSKITAHTRPGTTLVELFRALFPCGSVTGAPKHRTMELIAEVENDGRGLYCGAVGFVGPGQARFNVAIRTAVIDGLTGAAVFGSGGAIVWDSDPAEEYREAAAKAAILTARTNDFHLLETMAFMPGVGLRNRDRHLERLARSAEYFGFQFCRRTIGDQLDRAVAAPDAPVRVRLTLARSGQTSIETGPMGGQPTRPVRLALDDDPVDPTDVRLFHKTTDRAIYNERRHRHPNADDVVLVNTRGEVTEATIANVAVCVSGQWRTPPVAAGCLPGVARAGLVEDGTLIERTITVAQLRAATAVALVSSARGWRPAVIIDP